MYLIPKGEGMKDRSNSLAPSQGGQHPGVLPACKVQCSITALRQEQDLPSSRQCGYQPQPGAGTQLYQTSNQPCPGDPWHPMGASQVCLETTRLMQYASMWGLCIHRAARGSTTPFTIHPGTLISISSCLHSLPQWQPVVLPKTCGGIQRAGKCAWVCPAYPMQHVAGTAADLASPGDKGRSCGVSPGN